MKNTLEEPRNPDRVLILADMHLKPLDSRRANVVKLAMEDNERLAAFLDSVARDAGMLILLGDTFNFWFERRSHVVGDYLAALSLLKLASDRGLAIHHVSGNRDFVVGEGLGFDASTRYPGFLRYKRGFTVSRLVDFGIEPHGPRFRFHHRGKTVACVHGDALCGKQKLFMALRWLTQGPLGRIAMRLSPWSLAAAVIPLLQNKIGKRRVISDPERILVDAKIKWEVAMGADLLLCGHLHRPYSRTVEIAGRVGRMEVIPAWMDGYYGVVENGELRVEQFV